MYNIKDFGAEAVENKINTKAIQAAIDACSEAGGGTVTCPAGVYLTGTIWLKENVNLHLEAGCELKACTDKNEYNAKDCFPERDLVEHQNTDGTHLILAYRVNNISITGEGRLNGNCEAFFNDGRHEHRSFKGHYMYNMPEKRPGQMIYICRCNNVKIKDISIDNACFWSVYMLGCDYIKITGISIKVLEVPNGDGLHFNCCRNIIISDCDFDTQDDCLIFRGHYPPLGENIPCENVVVTNCLLKTFCCGFRIGVGDGVVRNCSFSNIVMHHTRQGINFMPAYSIRYPRGTDIDNINFSDITMDVMIPIYMSNTGEADLRNINFTGLKVNMTHSAIITGDANAYNDVTISDSVFNVVPGAKQVLGGMYAEIPNCSFYIENTSGLKMRDTVIRYREGVEKVDSVFNCIKCADMVLEDVDFCNADDFASERIVETDSKVIVD